MKTISLKISEQVDAELDALVRERGATGKSALVREAVQRYIETERKVKRGTAVDRIRDLIGKYRGPGDLSTNPKYLEDLGRGSLGNRRYRSARRRPRSK